MKDRYQVVVIGGGIVGCSVLYHLALRGCTDIALLEREELTAGSTWHAAGGFHAINADTRIAALQKYTIGLYPQVEEESGAERRAAHDRRASSSPGTPERWRWLESELAWLRSQDTRRPPPHPGGGRRPGADHRPDRRARRALRPAGGQPRPERRHARLRDRRPRARRRGDRAQPRPVAHAAAQRRVARRDRAGRDHGRARRERRRACGRGASARMVGVDHPLVPMPHHYLVTDDDPRRSRRSPGEMPAVTDLEGFTYLQREGNGVLLGVYEQNPRHWQVEGAEWDFGRDAVPRGARPDHARALDRVRALPRAGRTPGSSGG